LSCRSEIQVVSLVARGREPNDWSHIGRRFVTLVEDVAHEHAGGGNSA